MLRDFLLLFCKRLRQEASEGGSDSSGVSAPISYCPTALGSADMKRVRDRRVDGEAFLSKETERPAQRSRLDGHSLIRQMYSTCVLYCRVKLRVMLRQGKELEATCPKIEDDFEQRLCWSPLVS